jgi:hypothetical protein
MCDLFDVTESENSNLKVLNKEDYEDMLPLDTEDGQAWLDKFIAREGPFDFIFFDNIMALCVGIMKEEESWQALKPYVLELTKRQIGQQWIHHTGHDKTRSYGTKTREWQMDTVMTAEQLSKDHIDINLRFTKRRRSSPRNYENFEDVHIELASEWSHGTPVEKEKSGGRPTNRREIVLQALKKAIDADNGNDATEASWMEYAVRFGISESDNKKSQQKAFKRARDDVLADGAVKAKAGGRYTITSVGQN